MVDDMYLVLEQLYEEYFDIFQFDSFHYGGDEVCFHQNYLKIKKDKSFLSVLLHPGGFSLLEI